MYGQVHENRVLYKQEANNRYRQIVVVEMRQFEVRIFEGDVIRRDPRFLANSASAEQYSHPNLSAALDDAEVEFRKSVEDGWIPYDPFAQ
jgi:hypothetical protein